MDEKHRERVIRALSRQKLIKPAVKIGILGDDADNRVLECAHTERLYRLRGPASSKAKEISKNPDWESGWAYRHAQ